MEVIRKFEGKFTADEVKEILLRHIASELSLIGPIDIVFTIDIDCDRKNLNCEFKGIRFVSIEK